jgi:hypothetical protein
MMDYHFKRSINFEIFKPEFPPTNYATLNVLKGILRNNIAPCPIIGTEKETVRVKSARREYLKTIREVIASPQKR